MPRPTLIFLFGFWGGFSRAYFITDTGKKPTIITGSKMKRFAALLFTTTAISAATPVIADGYDTSLEQNEPFFWTDVTEAENAASQSTGGSSSDYTGTSTTAADTATMTGSAGDPRDTPPRNPMQETYPEEDAPQYHVPENGTARYLDDGCSLDENAPYAAQWARDYSVSGAPAETNTDPVMRRRGEMVGDDGVLEAIQDNPCALIYRRGGETAASANEYTHPDDIRRVNTLEDRRIPVHEVGRYTPESTGTWHQDSSNPFVDASAKWTVERGVMLSEMLSAWGEEAGYNVVWRSSHDYVVETDVVINGTFPEAAGQVIEAYKDANPPLVGDFYLSQRVLVVDSANEFDGR